MHCIALLNALHYIALHYIAFHCIVFQCIAFHSILMHYIAIYCIALHCTALNYIAFHCIALCLECIRLHSFTHLIAFYCEIMYCMTLHCIALRRNLTTPCGLGPPMREAIGEALNNACMAPETKMRAGKSLLKSFLFLSCLSYLLLPSGATPFHLPPY